jgi:hypothetical protein
MDTGSENSMSFFIGFLYLLGAIYCFWLGMAFLNKTDLENTIVYKLGRRLSKMLQDEKKILEREIEMNNPENSTKYAVFCFVLGTFSLLLAIFSMFAT